MKLWTQWRRPEKTPEVMSSETLTESAGYIPPKVQIENLLEAGKRLVEYRKEQYDFPDDTSVDESLEDPTRRPGYDLADASVQLQNIQQRLRSQAKAGKKGGSKDTATPAKVDPEQSSEVSTK